MRAAAKIGVAWALLFGVTVLIRTVAASREPVQREAPPIARHEDTEALLRELKSRPRASLEVIEPDDEWSAQLVELVEKTLLENPTRITQCRDKFFSKGTNSKDYFEVSFVPLGTTFSGSDSMRLSEPRLERATRELTTDAAHCLTDQFAALELSHSPSTVRDSRRVTFTFCIGYKLENSERDQ